MIVNRLVLFVLMVTVALSAIGHGQEPFPSPASPVEGAPRPIGGIRDDSPTPVFRSRVEAVALDVFVTDAEGNPVSGLTADDFELEEDGKRQNITTFQAVDIPTDIRSTDFPPAEPDVAGNDGPEGRIYVFGIGSIGEVQALRTRAFLRTFMERHFGPHDVAAVVQLGKGLATDGQDFTGNRRLILAAIDKLSGGFVSDGDQPRILTQALNEVIQVLGRMQGRHKSLLYFNTVPGYPWGDLIDYVGGGVGHLNAAVGGGRGMSTLTFDDAHGAMTVATRNNITVYPIDPVGLGIEPKNPMEFRALAELTGGFAHVNSNDFDGAFARIFRDASTYYMLGFNSDYRRTDGKYVRVKVGVKRPGLTVRTRSGYVNANRREYESALKTRGPQGPVVSALANPLWSAGHPVRVTAVPFKGAQGNRSVVVLTVETGLVPAARQPRADFRSGSVEIRYLATDAKRRIYPEFRHTATLSLPAAQADATGGRVRLVSQMELPEGQYQVRVAGGSDRNGGGVVLDLEVPDFSSRPLMMSGLAVAATAAQALPTVQATPDKKKIKTRTCRSGECVSADVRDVPLVAWATPAFEPAHPLHDALPAPPTTVREFRGTDTVTVFAEVYDHKPHRALQVRADLMPAAGPPALTIARDVTTEAPRASGGHAVSLQLALTGVPPGQYALRVEVRAAGSDDVTSREIPIRVR